MIDLIELSRSVVRVPVAGPGLNNTLVFVRGTFQGGFQQQQHGKIYHYTEIAVTAYQIDGFQQSRVAEYMANTRWSVAGFMSLIGSTKDQDFVAAIDSVEGHLSSDGTFFVTADTAMLIDANILELQFSLSAYILTNEPQPDFTRPTRRFGVAKERLEPKPFLTAGTRVRPISKEDEAQLLSVFQTQRIVDHECPPLKGALRR